MRTQNGWLSRAFIIGLLASVLLVVRTESPRAQVVSPLQPGHYAPGVMNVRDAVTPAPGLYVIWYNWFIWSDTYIDRNGNELKRLNLSEIDPQLPDVDVENDVSGFASVPVVAWTSPFTVLGGARYIAAIAPNFVVADVKTAVSPAGIPDSEHARRQESSLSGFSDLLVAPLGLSWALGRFKDVTATDEELAQIGMPPRRRFNITALYSFVAPTGRYETGADDNLGLGFWTHQFQLFNYYYPFEHQATAIQLGLTYELNSSIEDAEVKPGNRISLEWGASQYLSEQFEVLIQGAHNWQISDDSGSEVWWDPTVHDRKSTMLFGAGFWAIPQRFYVSAKYGFDFGMRQRFDNSNLMLNLILVPKLP